MSGDHHRGSTLVAGALLLLGVGMGTASADEAPGRATITAPGGGAIASGGSADGFGIELPSGAACAGDTATGGYLVQGYLIPATVDPESLTFGVIGPEPYTQGDPVALRQPLYDEFTSSFSNIPTAEATEPGGPGSIVGLPTFDLEVYDPGDIPPGSYRLGIACTVEGAVDDHWDAAITVVADPADRPAGLRWSIPGASEPSGGPGSGALAAGGIGLAVLGAATVRGLRSRLRAPHHPTPHT